LQGKSYTDARYKKQQGKTPLVEPDNQPVEKKAVFLIFDFPVESDKGHATMEQDKEHKCEDSDPIDEVLTVFHGNDL